MTATIFLLALLQNAAFLLAMVLVYQLLGSWPRQTGINLRRQALQGVMIGSIACLIMLSPIEYTPDIIFDTRTVVVSLCGLFFGPVPTLVAVAISSVFRLYLGGLAAWTGVGTIVVAGMAGLLWRYFRVHRITRLSHAELYLFGLVVHGIMLALMLTLPGNLGVSVLKGIALPVLLLFPPTTVLLGLLLADGFRREITRRELTEQKQRLRLALSATSQSLFDANLLTGSITFDQSYNRSSPSFKVYASLNQWQAALHPEDRDQVVALYQTILDGTATECRITFRKRSVEGAWNWIMLVCRVVSYTDDGRPSRLLGTFTDVTRSRETEHQLTEFRTLLDHSLDIIEVFDPDTAQFIDVNATGCRELGYSREEFLRLRVFDIADTALTEKVFHAGMQELREHGSMSWEGEHIRKDGSRYPVEIKLNLVSLDRDFIVATVRNVTDRRAMEKSLIEETHRHQNLIAQSRDGIVMIDANGKVNEANKSFADMLGYTMDEALELHVWDWEHNLPRAQVEQMLVTIDEHGDHFSTRHTCKDGSVIDVEISTNALRINDERLVLCICRDVTVRRQQVASLKLAAMVYENSREAMMVMDPRGNIMTINPTFAQITGYELEEVLGKEPQMLQSNLHTAEFFADIREELESKGHWSGEILDRRKNGEIYPEWLSINTVYDSDGQVQCRVGQFSDIKEKKDAEQLIWRQANFDTLTALPNRRMFQDRLNEEIKKADRSGIALALMFLDLDNFKVVNDTLGHEMGDLLLKQAADRLRECVRSTDTIARLGGDEFTIILSGLGATTNVSTIAQKMLWKLAEPFYLGNELAYVSVSIGITLYPADAEDAEGLLRNADQAMYGAKKLGRNCYHYFTVEMQEAVTMRMRLANDLREALVSDQLRVAYQPIVNLATGRINKAEALIRWQHPRDGLISPASFIPIAEECGLIGKIGDLVFNEVVRNCRYWRTFMPDIQISLNKSPSQFGNYGRTGQNDPWIQMLQEADLPGSCIVVEITEGLLLDARPEILDQLLSLRDAGIEVSLDDFGTGYSSLSYLKKFDIDYLKIDQSFIGNLGPGSDDLTLCEAIITMAHRLGLEVIAEGVETAAQAALLKAIGCDYAQGFLYSCAVPAEEFEQMLYRTNRAVNA